LERTERLLRGIELALFFLVAALMPVCLYCVFKVVPDEVTMGAVQRIFYFHVPSAWVAFLGFFVVFVSSILYLSTRRLLWDIVAHSAAELGVLYCSIVLFTGPIWARPVWGTWWTWEARLTTTLVLEMVFVAYLVLRTQAENRAQAARLSAVVGIVGFLDVPIIYYSVQIWRGHHPIVFKSSGGQGLEPIMLKTFMLCMTTFTLLFLLLLGMRIRLGLLRESVMELRERETLSGA
jgi:heme exporter protein C